MITNFDGFLFESVQNNPYGIKEDWSGGFTLNVIDETMLVKHETTDSLVIPKKTEKAVALSYYKLDGKLAEYFWIPLYALKKKSYSGSESRYKIEIPSYTKWFKEDLERGGLVNFLNNYIENLGSKENAKKDVLANQAKDDVDMIMDQIGIPDSVVEINKTKDSYKFTGKTENGLYVEIVKRSPEDMVGEFYIYPVDSDRPGFEYTYSRGQNKPNLLFRFNGKVFNRLGHLTEIEGDDFLNYLLKKSFGVESKSDRERLLMYFERICKSLDLNYQYSDDSRTYKSGQEAYNHAKEVSKILEDFMDKKEVDRLFNQFSKK
jgi:hypothetical protein